jgi:hypothetical protein
MRSRRNFNDCATRGQGRYWQMHADAMKPIEGKEYPSDRWCAKCRAYVPCTTRQVGELTVAPFGRVRVFGLSRCHVCHPVTGAKSDE